MKQYKIPLRFSGSTVTHCLQIKKKTTQKINQFMIKTVHLELR